MFLSIESKIKFSVEEQIHLKPFFKSTFDSNVLPVVGGHIAITIIVIGFYNVLRTTIAHALQLVAGLLIGIGQIIDQATVLISALQGIDIPHFVIAVDLFCQRVRCTLGKSAARLCIVTALSEPVYIIIIKRITLATCSQARQAGLFYLIAPGNARYITVVPRRSVHRRGAFISDRFAEKRVRVNFGNTVIVGQRAVVDAGQILRMSYLNSCACAKTPPIRAT